MGVTALDQANSANLNAKTSKYAVLETLCGQSRSSTGKTYTQKLINGGKLCASQAIIAKCFECCCGYVDGKVDCEVPGCALYSWMPYKNKTLKSS